MNPIVLIPARFGSTRLPGKVLADIGGKPMIAHVLDRALSAGLGPVAVACCEAQVAEAVEKAGGIAVMTDPDLPSGSDRIWAALRRLDPAGAHDVIVNLQGDLPSIEPSYLATVVKPLVQGFDIGTLVAPITTEAERDAPSVVKCACAFPGDTEVSPALYFSRHLIPSGEGPHWHHIGIYAYRRAALERFVALPPSPLELREKLEQLRALEAGLRIGAARVAQAPFGVDTPEDLDRAREALCQ
ncbi:3-deoxy-manno-octulosonate cytidylyltransferase [Acidocella facilis]|uniref:3-deoxy-manno-octulosonate cytidylyltransferase n=1 Tax=Acidocella facilis TaxID=525 RepID=UPI001F464BBE|nr:3-deoxy-manno-octulosonate cytidylyltransferase [Acidocella facilis]